jgi:hypothetical protein
MSRPLFTTAAGKPLHRTSAFRIVQRLAQRKAGIDGQISPHSLRHTFATIALDSGTSLHALQDSMGHADPRTTRRYDRARNNLQKSVGYDVCQGPGIALLFASLYIRYKKWAKRAGTGALAQHPRQAALAPGS